MNEFKEKIQQIILEHNIPVNFVMIEEHYKALLQVCGNENIDPRHVKGYIDSINRITKPPLGLISRWSWVQHRLDEIYDAMLRYMDVNKEVPYEWVCEYNEHINWFEENEPRIYEKLIRKYYQKI